RSPNVQEFLYSILFLLVVGYLVRTHLLFVSRAYIELRKLLNRYLEEIRGSAFDDYMPWGGGLAYGVKSIRFKKKYLNINLIDVINLISIIPNLINRINFSRNT
ncbi:hypothetical protein Goklo_013401, partial [Gossypium klotzschianum]|nr:hypothetical protein [Gossypium klotzschianum]